VWTEFQGEGTREVENFFGVAQKTKDPYVGCTPDSFLRVAATNAYEDLTIDRLNKRQSLLEQLETRRRDLERTLAGRSFSRFQDLALSLISSPRVSEALDVRNETESIRDMYGMTLFGQSCLAARRLLEAGTRLVTVFWDEYGLAGSAWDTHLDHYPRLKERLLPGFDMGFSGLILDLERRGMLDDTLVACISCHGRSPKLNDVRGGGRDHWSQAYSAVFAGGGISRGNVVGSTDKTASAVTSCPVSPKDVLATMYYLMGIDPHTRVHDKFGRPVPIVPDESTVVSEMLV
jgi:hypothetical protein